MHDTTNVRTYYQRKKTRVAWTHLTSCWSRLNSGKWITHRESQEDRERTGWIPYDKIWSEWNWPGRSATEKNGIKVWPSVSLTRDELTYNIQRYNYEIWAVSMIMMLLMMMWWHRTTCLSLSTSWESQLVHSMSAAHCQWCHWVQLSSVIFHMRYVSHWLAISYHILLIRPPYLVKPKTRQELTMAAAHYSVILPHMPRWRRERICNKWLQPVKAEIFYTGYKQWFRC